MNPEDQETLRACRANLRQARELVADAEDEMVGLMSVQSGELSDVVTSIHSVIKAINKKLGEPHAQP